MLTNEMIENVIRKIKEKTLTDKHIKINVVKEDSTLSIFDSKFGGIPYLPKEAQVPVDAEGTQLALLAQIKCEDLPENTLYPQNGLVQFWIGRDDIMGLDEEEGSKVIYYSEIDFSVTNDEVLGKYKIFDEEDCDEYSPIEPKNNSLRIDFEAKPTYVSAGYYDFDNIIVETINELYPDEKVEDIWNDIDESLVEYLFKSFDSYEHCIGGYPSFIQEDPRIYEEEKRDYNVLLLQVDTEFIAEERKYLIIWGDCGIANFFIKEEDLKIQNFSDVMYN